MLSNYLTHWLTRRITLPLYGLATGCLFDSVITTPLFSAPHVLHHLGAPLTRQSYRAVSAALLRHIPGRHVDIRRSPCLFSVDTPTPPRPAPTISETFRGGGGSLAGALLTANTHASRARASPGSGTEVHANKRLVLHQRVQTSFQQNQT